MAMPAMATPADSGGQCPPARGRLLGKGGMSEVYEATTPDGRRVALKVFRREKDGGFLEERFMAEARLLKTLYHPNIVRVHDFGICAETRRAWFTMDLVLCADGKARTLEDVRKAGGVEDAQLRTWFDEVRTALDYLHSCGVVHRDVKLENILIDSEGRARLADFGVSRIVDGRLREEIGVASTFVTGETTGTRPVMGTYFYLPPDVRGGAPATPETDGYALGVAFFRLLTGMWYEPGTNALDLLSPFPEFWRRELPKLLGRGRTLQSGRDVLRRIRSRRVGRVALVSVIAAVALGAVFTVWWSPRDRNSRSGISPSAAESTWSLPLSFSTPLVKRLSLGDGCEMEFCACPAGSFMMSGVGASNATCHEAEITRPFWIGRTVVTARQFRLEVPDAARDSAAAAIEAAFPEMDAAYRLWGSPIREYVRRLNMKYAKALPRGYVFRLPTEAELEYAIREGGDMPCQNGDIWWDAQETKRLVESAGLPFRDDLRLVPKCSAPAAATVASAGHRFGLSVLWTDTEQAVLDTVDGKIGTKTAKAVVAYGAKETDPLRTGALHMSRQARFQRWLMKEPSGFIRICIGPDLRAQTPPSPPSATGKSS